METRVHTALHILKGSVRKVLGDDARWTSGVHASITGGRLTIQFNRKPTDEELEEIEEKANKIVKENVKIISHQLSTEEAKKRFGDEHLDLFPVPDSVKNLTVVEIPGWNINACNKSHTKQTSEVGEITIRKTRFRRAKQRLEISYIIG